MSGLDEKPTVIGRRELLERGAWVSSAAALAWAAPSVATFGARAAAGTGEPPGGGEETPPDGEVKVSFIAFIFLVSGRRYAAKAEFKNNSWSWTTNGNAPFCDNLSDLTPRAEWQGLDDLSVAGFNVSDPPVFISYVGQDVVFTSRDTRLTFAAYAIKQATGCDTESGRINGQQFVAEGVFELGEEVPEETPEAELGEAPDEVPELQDQSVPGDEVEEGSNEAGTGSPGPEDQDLMGDENGDEEPVTTSSTPDDSGEIVTGEE